MYELPALPALTGCFMIAGVIPVVPPAAACGILKARVQTHGAEKLK